MHGHPSLVHLLSALSALCIAFSPAPAQAPKNQGESPAKQASAAGTDQYGDPLPKGVIARLGTVKPMVRNDAVGHRREVFKMKHTLDGKVLATAARDGTIRLWDLRTTNPIHLLETRGDTYNDIAFTSNGKQLVSCNDEGDVRVWDTVSGHELRRFPLHDASKKEGPWHIHKLHVTPDDQTAIVLGYSPSGGGAELRRGTLSSYDLATGRRKTKVKIERSNGFYSAFSPDGQLWVSSGELIDAMTGKRRLTLDTDVFGFRLAFYAYSADGRFVAGLAPDGSRVRSAETGKTLVQINTGEIGQYAFTPDARYLAMADIDGIRLWELLTGTVVRKHAAHDRTSGDFGASFASCIAMSPDGRSLVTGHPDGTILIWGMTPPAVAVTADNLPHLWTGLVSSDAAKAHDATWQLTYAPTEAVPYLTKQLRPAIAAPVEETKALLEALDSPDFKKRDESARRLRAFGDRAAGALHDALKANPTLEVRRRVEGLLKDLEAPPSGEAFGALRAVTVLERIGTSEARELLKLLANGDAEARLTREAKLSLERLTKRPGQ